MDARSILTLLLAYSIGTLLLVFVNLFVLDLGDPKFRDVLFSGALSYTLLWLLFYLPLALVAAFLVSRPWIQRKDRNRLVVLFVVVILGLLELAFILDLQWPYLFIEYALGTTAFLIVRHLVSHHHLGQNEQRE